MGKLREGSCERGVAMLRLQKGSCEEEFGVEGTLQRRVRRNRESIS
jgi:hypothetical protein